MDYPPESMVLGFVKEAPNKNTEIDLPLNCLIEISINKAELDRINWVGFSVILLARKLEDLQLTVDLSYKELIAYVGMPTRPEYITHILSHRNLAYYYCLGTQENVIYKINSCVLWVISWQLGLLNLISTEQHVWLSLKLMDQ